MEKYESQTTHLAHLVLSGMRFDWSNEPLSRLVRDPATTKSPNGLILFCWLFRLSFFCIRLFIEKYPNLVDASRKLYIFNNTCVRVITSTIMRTLFISAIGRQMCIRSSRYHDGVPRPSARMSNTHSRRFRAATSSPPPCTTRNSASRYANGLAACARLGMSLMQMQLHVY